MKKIKNLEILRLLGQEKLLSLKIKYILWWKNFNRKTLSKNIKY
jgi:hypothetical protein